MSIEARRALVQLLRTAAEREEAIEGARRRLCALPEFGPAEAFSSLRMDSKAARERTAREAQVRMDEHLHASAKARAGLTSSDLHVWRGNEAAKHKVYTDLAAKASTCLMPNVFHEWLQAQPHEVSDVPTEEFMDWLAEFCVRGGVAMNYETFLQLVLPRDTPELRREVCGRAPQEPWRYDAPTGRIPPEVAHRFCDLVRLELEFGRQLRPCRQAAKDRGVDASVALAFMVPSPGGELERQLVEVENCLDAAQCRALSNRLDQVAAHAAAAGPGAPGIEAVEWLLVLQHQPGALQRHGG